MRLDDVMDAARTGGPIMAGAMFGARPAAALLPRGSRLTRVCRLARRTRHRVVHMGRRGVVLRAHGAPRNAGRAWLAARADTPRSFVTCAPRTKQTPALWYLPGFLATLALLMVNAVRREELGYDPDGLESRKRAWLLVSYLVSFGAVGWSIAGLIVYFNKDGHDAATGAAGVVQTVLIVGSALLYWVTRGAAGGGDFFY